MSEAQEQATYFEWSTYVPELRWAYAIPNGGKRDKREAASLKRQGVKAGVSDIFVPLPIGIYHGLYIEMKVGRNKPTEKQTEFLEYAKGQGYAVAVCYGADEAIAVTRQYLRGKRLLECDT